MAKHEIYQDGRIRYTIESTDGKCDLVTMPKVLIKECNMTAKGFEELFFIFLKGNVSHTQAYEEAEKVHEAYFEKRKYLSFEVFKSSRSQRHKRK